MVTASFAPRLVVTLAVAAAALGCKSDTGPTPGIDTSLTLSPGETLQLPGTQVRVTFVGVEGDSRCPADAVCIQGGDAIVRFRVDDDGVVRTIDLRTASRQEVRVRGLTVHLAQLLPYPFSSQPIDPEDYRATVRLTR